MKHNVFVFQFGGTEGEWFQKLTARFCSHQSWALDQIKTKQKKDPRFNSFIQVTGTHNTIWVKSHAKGHVNGHIHVLSFWLCVCSNTRKQRVNPSAADCSSKTLFLQRCRDWPSTPCFWRILPRTQVWVCFNSVCDSLLCGSWYRSGIFVNIFSLMT